jgi:hypothetical protein
MFMVDHSGLYNWTGVCVDVVVNLVRLESRELVEIFGQRAAETKCREGDY